MSAVIESGLQQGTLTIRPLQPTIGAEIEGVDLRYPLADTTRDQIKAAILQYKVVFFRDQELDRDQHGAFARQFGPLYTHPSVSKSYADKVPAIHQISAVDAQAHQKSDQDQAPIGPQAATWDPYHSDTSWRLVPTWGAVLRAVTLPEVGGDTIWVDAGLAYDTLPDDAKQRLEGLHVTPDYRAALLSSGHDYPIVAHPVVRTHRETGRTSRSTPGSSGWTGTRAGNSCPSHTTSTVSRSSRCASAGGPVRSRSGTTGRGAPRRAQLRRLPPSAGADPHRR